MVGKTNINHSSAAVATFLAAVLRSSVSSTVVVNEIISHHVYRN